ncbi:hypothetical protein PPECC9_25490, partial [Escherichia coli PCN009]
MWEYKTRSVASGIFFTNAKRPSLSTEPFVLFDAWQF